MTRSNGRKKERRKPKRKIRLWAQNIHVTKGE